MTYVFYFKTWFFCMFYGMHSAFTLQNTKNTENQDFIARKRYKNEIK